jgi:Flp pilus assembly protein TadG
MKRLLKSESGTIIIALALFITLLLSFLAFGTEAGRWYLLRAEISKAVDAGALAGAKNLSNPYMDPKLFAAEVCAENFPTGAFGTPGSGTTGTATFNVDMKPDGRVDVTGHATSPAIMAQLLGIHDVPVSSAGAAQMRAVEIMMVLDRSGSMGGQPFADLKVASKGFLDYFTDSQATDKIGLISFSTSVKIERRLGNNFVAPLKTAIDRMSVDAWTNAEDAIDQSDGPMGFTNQTGVPVAARTKQFLVFFSDGRPNVFRGWFRNRGSIYDALVRVGAGNCDPGDNSQVAIRLMNSVTGQDLNIDSRPTGDGVLPSKCGANKVTTRWLILNQRPVPGYAPDACGIPEGTLHNHLCTVAADLAILHAQELKDAGITVLTIGLGQKINGDFLEALASGPDQVYRAYTSADLPTIFQKVAQDIKLRLVL